MSPVEPPNTILVVGEAIGDFIPRDAEGRQYEAVLGGSGFNAALALARFGARPAYAGSLSTDALGRRFRAALMAEGIDRRFVQDSARPTAVAIVSPLGPDGTPEFALHLDGTAHDEAQGTPRSMPTGFVHLHAASFGATTGPSGEATSDLAASARAAGATVSYDINIRAAVLPERDRARALIEARIAQADIVKASLDDLAWLHPGEPAEAVALRWQEFGARLVLVTRGGEGAIGFGAFEPLAAAAPPVVVADTVGAGDCFIGGFLAVLGARGLLGRGFAGAGRDDLQAGLDFACTVAADSCTRPGCDPPRRIAV
ncbi:MAG TPA: carbohydrate kinase [Bosea sp. (in: a-proteobacteria)]|jgi:fructokinase|uniref:carbohydrate kinase family protein n=1 Tax=Bosea sp. (in: a-proteobacteria) TaxID=1871050 RepID=UPI002DDD2671|nr:carbohydrate kinase [Bosea sp. (in: a-proteobacteria)]HEV2556553.1 carbohydrate kinase [Bosea sp. (in: a-proteobacteria)]